MPRTYLTRARVKRIIEEKRAKNKMIHIITHNLQKYSRSTHGNVLMGKRMIISDILSNQVPDIYLLQEINDSKQFKQDIEKDSHNRYFVSTGPSFVSGSYKESYPIIFNPTTIHFQPKVYSQDRDIHITEDDTLEFSVKDKVCRPNISYEIMLPASRYNLRPARKSTGNQEYDKDYADRHSNLSHRRYMKYTPVRIIPVHTSPSLSIPEQCESIKEYMEQLSKSQITMAAGDFYAEKGAKKFMKTNEGVIRLPNEPTNYGYKDGIATQHQKADMFMVPDDIMSTEAKTIMAPSLGIKQGSDYLQYNIDHVPVSSCIYFPIQEDNQRDMSMEMCD